METLRDKWTVNWLVLLKPWGISACNSWCTLTTCSLIVEQYKGQRGPGVQSTPWGGVFLGRIKAKFLQPFSQQHEQVLLFLWRIVRDQISIEFVVHILSYLILTSWVTVSVNLFFFFALCRMFPLWLGKVFPWSGWKRAGRTNFLFIPLTAAFPLQQFCFVFFFT